MKNKNKLSAAPLKALLERVCLGGLIDECLLIVKEGVGNITAVDTGGSVLLAVSEELSGIEKGKYGISMISTLIKFLGMCKDKELTYAITDDKKWLQLHHKGHGKLSVMLLETEMVSTKLNEDPAIAEEMKKYKVCIDIEQRFIDDALRFMSLVSVGTIAFKVAGGRVQLISGFQGDTQQFEVPLGECKDVEDFECATYAPQVIKVLSVMRAGKSSRIYLHSKKKPIIIQQDSKNVWALSSVVE